MDHYEDLALVRGLSGLFCSIIAAVILTLMIRGLLKSTLTRGPLEWIVIYLSTLTIIDDLLFLVIMAPALAEWFGVLSSTGNWTRTGQLGPTRMHYPDILSPTFPTLQASPEYPQPLCLTDHTH